MQFKNMSEKIKKTTENKIHYIFKLPIKNLILGTVIVIVPGSLVVTATYVMSNRLLKKYKEYNNTKKKPINFIKWFSIETSLNIKCISQLTSQKINKTRVCLKKIINKDIKNQ